MMERRANGGRVAVVVTAVAAALVAGCASNRPPPEPIHRLVVLPAERNDTLHPLRERQPEYSLINGVVPYLVHLAIDAQQRRSAEELRLAIARVGFDPVARINERVFAALEKAGVKYEMVQRSAGDVFTARIARDFTAIAGDADAVLDLRIAQFGYYDETSRAGGYLPMLGIHAHFWSTKSYAENGRLRMLIGQVVPSVAAKTNPEIGAFRYWFDWRQDPGNPRWFTSGPELIFPDIAAIVENREKLRAKFEEVMDSMIAQLALDVKSRMTGSSPTEARRPAPEPESPRD